MPIKILVTHDFEHMSRVGADLVEDHIVRALAHKPEMVLGLATGNSPTGVYRHLARAANAGEFDATRIRSFNLDEYVGLPGENAQQRVLHRESYCTFMIEQFFSRLGQVPVDAGRGVASREAQHHLALLAEGAVDVVLDQVRTHPAHVLEVVGDEDLDGHRFHPVW